MRAMRIPVANPVMQAVAAASRVATLIRRAAPTLQAAQNLAEAHRFTQSAIKKVVARR